MKILPINPQFSIRLYKESVRFCPAIHQDPVSGNTYLEMNKKETILPRLYDI